MSDPVAATTVKADSAPASGAASGEGAAPAPAAPVTALSAIQNAFKEEAAPVSSAGTAAGAEPPKVDGAAPAGVIPPSAQPGTTAQPPADSPGVAQLRTAYNELKTKYSWAADLNPQEVREWMDERRRFHADPVAWYRQLGNELGGHPNFKEALAPPKEDPEPKPDLYQVIDGERVFLYSAEQQAKRDAWKDRQFDRKFEERLNPMQRWVTEAQSTTERNNIIAGAKATTTRVLGELRTYPHFKEGEAKIADRLRAMDPRVKKEIGTIAALHLAYTQYLKEDVFPSRDAEVKKQVEAEWRKKANAGAGSSVPSGGSTTAAGGRPSNAKQLADKLKSGAYAT